MISRLLLSLLTIISACSIEARIVPDSKRVHFNTGRGYSPFQYATSSGIDIHNQTGADISDGIHLPDSLSDFSISFRATNISCHPSKRFTYTDSKGSRHHRANPEWRFWLSSQNSDTLFFTIKSEDIPDPISSMPAIRVSARLSCSSDMIASQIIKGGVDCHSGTNSWDISVSSQTICISAGNHTLIPVLDITSPALKFVGFGFTASPAAHILVSDITVTDNTPVAKRQSTEYEDIEKLKTRLENPQDSIEGYWTLFDRTLEETLLQMGGDYRLAIIKEGDKYLILYLSGAKTNASAWKPGMIKGRLIPDPFPETYSVVWYDSEGNPLSKDIKAQLGEGSTLLIQFPYQSSVVRLRKHAINGLNTYEI